MSTQGKTHRSDIDGLRAVAVLAVIIYHADLALPGGYVGVDVFFVISGYLITGLIARDLDRGSFSMRDFWKRRILRIWPAAFAMVFAVLAAAVTLMIPRDLEETARDAISQMFMTANITFWKTADYFRPETEIRPLLHCWSLAVEEQFYIVMPTMLALIWAFGRRWVWAIVAAGAVGSFVLSIVMLQIAPSGTFYLLPTRAWEMALGSILALSPLATLRRGMTGEWCALLGLTAIIVPMLLYDSFTSFPGLAALPICLGSVLLLATPDSFINRLLSIGPMRAIGLVSYSLYLWHWPIFAFLRYLEGRDLSLPTTLLALLATAITGVLSWRFIEQPFRRQASQVSFARTAVVAGAVLAGGTLVALVPIVTHGLPNRLSAEVLAYADPEKIEATWTHVDGSPFRIGDPSSDDRVLPFLFGDSHAGAIAEALEAAAMRQSASGWVARRPGANGCPIPSPVLGSDVQWVERTLAWSVDNNVTDVLLCARWSKWLEIAVAVSCGSELSDECEDGVLESTVTLLAELQERLGQAGIRLWFLREVPVAPDPKHAARRAYALGEQLAQAGISMADHARNQERVTRLLTDPRVSEVLVWDLATPLFDRSEAQARVRDDQGLFYIDDNHLTTHGASMLIDHLSLLLEEIRKREYESRSQGPGRDA